MPGRRRIPCQLYNYIKKLSQHHTKEPGKQQAILGYQKLKDQILEILAFIQNQFPANINPHQPLPNCLFEEQKTVLQQQVDDITLTWDNKIDAALLELMLQPARDFINTATGPNPSYGQWKYLLKLFEKIHSLSLVYPPDTNTAFLYILINCNFNQETFIDYAVATFQQKLAEEETLMEKMTKYQKLLNYLQRLHPRPGMILHPGQPGCQQILIRIIKQEIHLLKKQYDHLLAIQDGKAESLPSGIFEATTCLSGAQIALFLRLFNDCEVLKCSPIKDLFKLVAETIQPSRLKHYTSGTIKTKYHEPDRSAINVVKDYLIIMMNLLKTY